MENIPDGVNKWLLEVQIYTKVLEKDESEVKIYFNRGIAYSKLGKVEEALDDFNLYLKSNPKDSDAHFEVGVVQEKLEKFDLAAEAYTLCIENSVEGSRNHDCYYNRGLCFDVLGKFEEAIRDYNVFMKRYPRDTKAMTRKGLIYIKLKEFEKSLELFEKCVKLKPQIYSHHFQLAILYDTHLSESDHPDKIAKALKHYTKCIELDPSQKEPFFNRGVIYEDKEEYNQALRDFYVFNKLEPKSAEAFFHIGYLYKEMEKYEYALKCLNSALKFNEDHVDSYFNRGMVYKEMEEYEKALTDFKKHLSYINEEIPEEVEGEKEEENDNINKPEEEEEEEKKKEEEEEIIDPEKSKKSKADTYFQIGFLIGDLIEPNNPEKAVENYNSCLKYNPDDQEAIFNRGIALRKLTRYEDSLKDFERFQSITEDHKDLVNYQIGLVYLKGLKKPDEAIKYFKKSLEIDRENCDTLFDLAECYVLLNQFQKSLARYNSILKLYPDDHECWYKKAIVFQKMKNKEKALEYTQKALSFQPDNEQYSKLKNEIIKM